MNTRKLISSSKIAYQVKFFQSSVKFVHRNSYPDKSAELVVTMTCLPRP